MNYYIYFEFSVILIFVLWCTEAFLTFTVLRKNLNPVFASAFEVQMVSLNKCAFVVSRIGSVWVDRNDFNVDFRDLILQRTQSYTICIALELFAARVFGMACYM